MKLTCLILTFAVILTVACKKDKPEIKGNADLKTLSLPELKSFLNGKWLLQYSLLYSSYTGYEKYSGDSSSFVFFPVDSLAWIDKTGTVYAVRDKIQYEWKKNSYNDTAYVLSFYVQTIGFNYYWTADRLVNDTLIFVDNSRVGSSYYLTREP